MFSYLHAFHAGNLADVHKHLGLFLALSLMQRKETAIACFDTHAGSAVYDLNSAEARKTTESDRGIQALWQVRSKLQDPAWQDFFSIISAANGGKTALQYYPGSPAWFARLRRRQDSLTTFELHPRESARLEAWGKRQAARVYVEDGFSGLLRCVPPREPRLCVLIDPPYEVKHDYRQVVDTLANAWRRCRHGVFLVWYPILRERYQDTLIRGVEKSPLQKVLRSELLFDPEPVGQGMLGSGLLVVNPPWHWEEQMNTLLSQALPLWGVGARHEQQWLIPE
ncbi:23S rRNA (adenine(2030)-N(6))-methyltransferase RlmJ [Mangrovitalea sediminis]|uniref:23S rRNA (adenine(2030)-N(6))-methyltransferase RlmJ n=1 Tax=Mangrovitalea sediminis TaxID=1982043 RepID=UPI000BE5E454|nr:23S rRNA (adenine(2030)-N(6))-methyltransferase RlmJ [Mangrovitalea sediminis]